LFVDEVQAVMRLARAGEDEDGVIVAGGDLREVHVDFAGTFRDTGINAAMV
jgi:hypothetical protein